MPKSEIFNFEEFLQMTTPGLLPFYDNISAVVDYKEKIISPFLQHRF